MIVISISPQCNLHLSYLLNPILLSILSTQPHLNFYPQNIPSTCSHELISRVKSSRQNYFYFLLALKPTISYTFRVSLFRHQCQGFKIARVDGIDVLCRLLNLTFVETYKWVFRGFFENRRSWEHIGHTYLDL